MSYEDDEELLRSVNCFLRRGPFEIKDCIDITVLPEAIRDDVAKALDEELWDYNTSRDMLSDVYDSIQMRHQKLSEDEYEFEVKVHNKAEDLAEELFEHRNGELMRNMAAAKRFDAELGRQRAALNAEQKRIAEHSLDLARREEELKVTAQALPHFEILKDVLLELELEEAPEDVALRLRHRFGLLIAQW